MRAGETEDIEGKYKTLKKQRFEAVDKFSYISAFSAFDCSCGFNGFGFI